MYFHHQSIRNYTTAMLEVFSDIEVQRLNEDGEVIKTLNVPIVFSSRERAVQLIDRDYSTDNNVLPKLALTLNSMGKAQTRDTNRNSKLNIESSDKLVTYQPNSVAYDFNFTLHILTRTMSDLTVILEQILPLFNPTYNIRMKELVWSEKDTSIPISLGGVSFDFPVDISDEDDIRVLTADLDLTLRGNLYLPIKETKIINEVNVLIREVSDRIKPTNYQNFFDNDSVEFKKIN